VETKPLKPQVHEQHDHHLPDVWRSATEAMRLHASHFPNSKIRRVSYQPEGHPGGPQKIIRAKFVLNDQEFIAIDSMAGMDYFFTPAISLFVKCQSEAEMDCIFQKRSAL
jgi:predicted 3-demethylubiquinone-9 3-methyltransferase (glyoxalase superfamily)